MIIALIALVLASIAQPAEARHGGAFLLGLGLGILLTPPLIHATQPPVVYEPHYYPAPPPESDTRYYQPPAEKVWVPSHWVRQWNPHYRVWEKFWVPGHWRYYSAP